MINRVNVLNIVTNKSIDIDKGGKEYILEEIDWDSPSVSMNTYRVPYQIGETLSGVMVGIRKPTIIGYVIADMSNVSSLGMTWEEYYKIQEQKIEESKLFLDKMFSIFQDVVINANGYYLNARPIHPPKYSISETENNEVQCKFELSFECYEPLFYKNSKTIDLALVEGKFKFPLIIPEKKGIIMGEVMKRQSMNIENNGDIDIGCVIKITANGGIVKDPKIYNVNTGEYIGFENVTLNDGDYVTITTTIGEENAIKHDIGTAKDISVIGNITKGSKFIKVKHGNNFYAYEVSQEFKNNIEVSINFMERYFNVKGM